MACRSGSFCREEFGFPKNSQKNRLTVFAVCDCFLLVQEIMCHPWVTDEGRSPLRSCADLGLGSIEVTAQEQLGAIDRASVVSMIRARLKEKVFRSNDYLFQTVRFTSTAWLMPLELKGLVIYVPSAAA